MTIGEKIKNARMENGLTQEELASKMMVSRQAITKWEADKGIPDVSNLKLLAQLLNVSVDYLLDDGGKIDINVIHEMIDLSKYGVKRNKCIDDDLMIRFAHEDTALMKQLNVKISEAGLFGDIPENAIDLGEGRYAEKTKDNGDKGQREFCGCVMSKDIGEYNTCIHLCEYCYANSSKQIALTNYKCHMANPNKDTITGR